MPARALGLEPKLWIAYGASKISDKLGRFRVLTDKYYKPETKGVYEDEGFVTDATRRGGYKVNVVNEVVASEEKEYNIGEYISDHRKNKKRRTMQVVWVTGRSNHGPRERTPN